MSDKKTEKDVPRNEQILDGCTRAKQAAIALKRLHCSILQVSVGGKYPTIKIEPPPKSVTEELKGERVARFIGAGGAELAKVVATFMFCRVAWIEPVQ